MWHIYFSILALAVSFWFILKEYPTLYGIVVPTCILRRKVLKITVITSMAIASVIAALFTGSGAPAVQASGNPVLVHTTVLASSLLTLMLLEYMGIPSPAALAVFGAMEASALITVPGYGLDALPLLYYAGAVVSTLCLSSIFYLAIRWLICHSDVHMLRLSEYMRMALVCAVVVLSLGVGFNYGGFFSGMLHPAAGRTFILIAVTAVIVLPQFLFWRRSEYLSNLVGDRCTEWNTRTILSVILSLSVVYILFNILFIGNLPPLAPVPLVYAGIAGVQIARKRVFVETETVLKGIAGMFIAPVLSFIFTYLVLRLSGDGMASDTLHLADFSLILLLLAIILVICAAAYVSAQVRGKKEVERLLYAQQNEIYQNNRAINELEIKSVLNENQLLHDTLELKRKEAMNIALSICEQKEYLESLNTIVSHIAVSDSEEERGKLIGELQSSIKNRLSFDQEIDSFYFYAQAEAVHKDFALRLAERFPELTEQEKRLVTLLRLGFSSKYIASLMNISTKSVEIGRYRLRQKLKLSKGDNLVNFIKSL